MDAGEVNQGQRCLGIGDGTHSPASEHNRRVQQKLLQEREHSGDSNKTLIKFQILRSIEVSDERQVQGLYPMVWRLHHVAS